MPVVMQPISNELASQPLSREETQKLATFHLCICLFLAILMRVLSDEGK